MTTVALFADFACPWCYLGRARLKRAIEGLDATVKVVHFPLSADTPPEGRDLRAILAARGIDVDAATDGLRKLLAAEGLAFRPATHDLRGYDTRKAQELALWAETQPGGATVLHDALFHAVHVDGRNVSDDAVLVDIARSVGLDGEQAEAAILSGAFALELDRHWTLGARLGVRSVPTFVIGSRGLVGAQEVDTLRTFVASGGVPSRP